MEMVGKEWDDMKLTKQQLKDVVKECLVEILSEGVTPVRRNSQTSSPSLSESSFRDKSTTKQNQKQQIVPDQQSRALYEAIRRESNGDPVMAEILADTAIKTLPAMQEAESRRQPIVTGTVEKLVSESDPKNLFGEDVASKWAALAFNEIGKKN